MKGSRGVDELVKLPINERRPETKLVGTCERSSICEQVGKMERTREQFSKKLYKEQIKRKKVGGHRRGQARALSQSGTGVVSGIDHRVFT